MVTLAERVRWLRKQRGYTLRDVAERAHVALSFLSDIERGAVPSLAVMERIARVYDLTLGEALVDVVIVSEDEDEEQQEGA